MHRPHHQPFDAPADAMVEVVIDITATCLPSSKQKTVSMEIIIIALILFMTTSLTVSVSAWSAVPALSSTSSLNLNNRRCSSHLKHGRRIDYSSNKFRKLSLSSSSSSSQLEMLHVMIDPITDLVTMATQQHQYHPSTTSGSAVLDMLSSSITLAKANAGAVMSISSPNQSIAPLPETLQSILGTTVTNGSNGAVGNIAPTDVIPDMYTMPGGTPKIGNTFLSGLFREMYDMGVQPHDAKMIHYYNANNNNNNPTVASGSSTAVVVPGRELDIVARYADLLSRIPFAAAIYAIIDFFVINAQEDVTVSELQLSYENDNDDDDENDEYEDNNSNSIDAIMDVENRVFMQRIGGLFSIVLLTITWSLLTYHPVPFNEL